MNRLPILQVDAFTAKPFRGNPAGVCVLPQAAPEAWMQAVAAEMNLSETAFLRRRAPAEFAIRWFTPTMEVPLCGHATLASAHALWEEGYVSAAEPITFRAKKGRLKAHREGDWIRLDFPALPVVTAATPVGLAEALGAKPVSIYQNGFPAYLVEVDSEAVVRRLTPDIAWLRNDKVGRYIVTAWSASASYDFVSRFFAPGVGIDEDPVTGSAHCSLGPYWAQRLGKTELVAHQVSKRGGVLRIRVHDDRVDLMGQAVTILRGELSRSAMAPTVTRDARSRTERSSPTSPCAAREQGVH